MATFKAHPQAEICWEQEIRFTFADGGAFEFAAAPAVAMDFEERLVSYSEQDERTILYNGESIAFAGEEILWP